MKNYKTTLSGIFGAVGVILSNSEDVKLKIVGNIITAVAVLVLGYHSTDKI